MTVLKVLILFMKGIMSYEAAVEELFAKEQKGEEGARELCLLIENGIIENRYPVDHRHAKQVKRKHVPNSLNEMAATT